MKLKTWHWIVIALIIVGLIAWVVAANKKKEEVVIINPSTSPAPGSNLSSILTALFPFFEKATDKKPA